MASLSLPMRERLDALVAVAEDDPFSALYRIKPTSSKASPAGMRQLLAKLELIEDTGIQEVGINWINANYQRFLFRSVSAMSADRLRELVAPRRWLAARSRTTRLADLLIEVENDLAFRAHFHHPGEARMDAKETGALLTAILAHGCNLGPFTMEKVAPDIPYEQLKHISDWRLAEDNQRAALAAVVDGISNLDATVHWGEGRTSASDAQRFAMPYRVLQQTYSTRFNDFAFEFYSFVADNYAPFYSRPIESTDRDAAFAMFGMRFCLRIPNVHLQRIYCADRERNHRLLGTVLHRGRRAVNFRLIAEQWERIGTHQYQPTGQANLAR